MTVLADVEATLNALMRQRQALVDEYIQRAWTMFRSMSPADWWNDAVTQGVGAYIAEQQIAFVKRMRSLAISYADIMLGLVNVTPDGQIPEYVVTRDNTDPWKVAVRPVESYRDLAVRDPTIRPDAWDGLDEKVRSAVDDWLDAALGRLTDTAETDGQLASTHSTIERYKSSGVTRYRRVVHPELSRTGSCGLCVVASDRLYSVAALLPLHSNCKCGVMPVTDDSDPGSGLSGKDLDRIYRKAWESLSDKRREELEAQGFTYTTYGRDLMNVRVTYATNGEIGPVVSREDAEVRDVPDRGSSEWHTPDREMTEQQMHRMYERAVAFDAMYRKVYETGQDVSFRYDGHTYRFKPSNHLKQAWDYHRRLLNSLRVTLGLAA